MSAAIPFLFFYKKVFFIFPLVFPFLALLLLFSLLKQGKEEVFLIK